MIDLKSQSLILKVLLISHGVYFFKFDLKISAYIILAAIVLAMIPKFSSCVDVGIEKLVRTIGLGVFKIVLTLFYILVFIPLSFFVTKKKTANTSYEEINKTEINFERPW